MARSELALLLTLAACSGGGEVMDAGTAKTEVPCELGLGAPGGFTPLATANRLELVLGFQGFLFVVVHAKAEAAPGERVDVTTSLELEGGRPFGGPQRGVMLRPLGTGAVTEDINVFLESSNVREYADREGTLGLRVESATWTCTSRAEIQLVDEDPCIHTGTMPVCPDAGVGDAG